MPYTARQWFTDKPSVFDRETLYRTFNRSHALCKNLKCKCFFLPGIYTNINKRAINTILPLHSPPYRQTKHFIQTFSKKRVFQVFLHCPPSNSYLIKWFQFQVYYKILVQILQTYFLPILLTSPLLEYP